MAEERSTCLVVLGWFFLLSASAAQVFFLTVLVAVLHGNVAFASWFVLFIPGLILVFTLKCGEWRSEQALFLVPVIYCAYIVPYVITIAMMMSNMLFIDVAERSSTFYSPLFIFMTLSPTPLFLMIFLQLAISPKWRKPVFWLSAYMSLNIFDSIEMLKLVFFPQEFREIKVFVVVFACLGIILSSLSLVRKRFLFDGQVVDRGQISMALGGIEVIGINVPFLVLRILAWGDSVSEDDPCYESSIFMVKNVICLLFGALELCYVARFLKCGVIPASGTSVDWGLSQNEKPMSSFGHQNTAVTTQ